jgi:branched-chain amino acid transport system ATP-binding protein
MTLALKVDGLTKYFGGVRAVSDLSFEAQAGETLGLIGPNGAGKTSVFNLISGVYPVDLGRVEIHGRDITHMPSRQRARVGLARNFQNVRLMPHLTVLENLIVGQHVRAGLVTDLLIPYRLIPNHRWKREAREALAECGLEAYASEAVQALPYGVRKQVDLIRATLAGARLLMLDEPAAGLNPTESNALRDHLRSLKERGITLLLVEHDMHFVRNICDQIVVLNFGEKIAEGSFDQVRQDARVREAYLGQEGD